MAVKWSGCVSTLVKMSRSTDLIGKRVHDRFPRKLTVSCCRSITCTPCNLEQSPREPKLLTPDEAKTIPGFLGYFRTVLSSPGQPTGEEIRFVLNSCGPQMSNESGPSRDNLLKYVWQELEKQNTKLGISLWNLRLRIHIKNGCNICPISFLQEMDEAMYKVDANDSTFEMLVEIYGAQGDTANTRQMISHIMSGEGKLTEEMYGSLLQAFAKRGDIDSVKVVMDSLATNEFPITHVIYGYLLKGYAETGDMKRIDDAIREMVSKNLRPTIDIYIGLFEHLSQGGHFDELQRALAKIDNLATLLPRLQLLVDQFVANDQIESAFIVLKELKVKPVVELYKAFLRAEKDISEYAAALKVVERTSEGNPFFHLKYLVHFLHFHHSPNAVLELFDYMISEGAMARSDVVKVVFDIYDSGYTDIVNVADALQINMHTRTDTFQAKSFQKLGLPSADPSPKKDRLLTDIMSFLQKGKSSDEK